MAGLRRRLWLLAGIALVAAIVVMIVAPPQAAEAGGLGLLSLYSLARMFAAYLIALVFAIAYGTTAATNKKAATVMLPLLDVLQSIPILAFFPAVLFFFVNTFNGSPIGLEISVVVLVFTSMAWNMAFGVYEAITTIPQDLEDAAAEFGVTGWLRFRRLMFPAAVPKLVYNSILSWTNGWFFLVASEVFTAFGRTYTRPGIGSFIAAAGIRGDSGSIALGLAALVVVVLAVDALVWRPLSGWADAFRLDVPRGEMVRAPRPYERLRWIPRFPGMWHRITRPVRPLLRVYDHASFRLEHAYTRHPTVPRTLRRVDLAMFLVVFVIVVGAGLVGLAGLFLHPPAEAGELPAAVVFSFARLLLAYGLALAWTIPVAAYVGRSAHAARIVTPVLEVFASVPATALLPVILGFAIAATARQELGLQLASVLIALFSMQWYLLFNLIGGVRSIPGDLSEAARVFGLRGLTYWRRVLLPAIVPSFLTGSITAWGAGWNALIVSEYFPSVQSTPLTGLGGLLDKATFLTGVTGDNQLLLFTIFTMIFVVFAMNKLLWHPLLKRAFLRYRVEAQ
ncbi:MAG TPA: ABC transporter permease subunit [Thermoplasmata archaeon]|nr:ABC transporter permease subunit [Thermoplasmata archaeon]